LRRGDDVHVDRADVRAQWNANAEAWAELTRAGYDVYRDLVNTPAFLRMLPPVAGLRGLDLGCGEGHNTRLVERAGARLVAIDVAERFVTAAAAAAVGGIDHVVGDATRLPFCDDTFDFATAFMSLMDVSDPDAALAEIARVVRRGGFVQLSIVHPVNNTARRRWVDVDGERWGLAIGDYFVEGPSTDRWSFGAAPAAIRERHEPFTVTSTRRTIAGWLSTVIGAGLTIEAVVEPCADDDIARAHPEIADTRIVPYFLIIRARRPD
jgi:SAM-dependent methyltransferase